MKNKPMKDWTFEELVDHMSWSVVEGLLKGEPLKRLIFTVCDVALMWKKESDK